MSLRRLYQIAPAAALTAGLLLTQLAQAASASLYTPAMRWTEDTGQTVTLDQWRGKLVLISMAYSTCRRTCSLTLKKLEELQAELDRKKLAVEIVVVSYDPKNDTPATWADYRQQRGLMRKNWHFLTGNERDTRQLSRLLGLADFWSYDGHVLHDFKIAVLGSEGDITRQIAWQDLHLKNIF